MPTTFVNMNLKLFGNHFCRNSLHHSPWQKFATSWAWLFKPSFTRLYKYRWCLVVHHWSAIFKVLSLMHPLVKGNTEMGTKQAKYIYIYSRHLVNLNGSYMIIYYSSYLKSLNKFWNETLTQRDKQFHRERFHSSSNFQVFSSFGCFSK